MESQQLHVFLFNKNDKKKISKREKTSPALCGSQVAYDIQWSPDFDDTTDNKVAPWLREMAKLWKVHLAVRFDDRMQVSTNKML